MIFVFKNNLALRQISNSANRKSEKNEQKLNHQHHRRLQKPTAERRNKKRRKSNQFLKRTNQRSAQGISNNGGI